MAMILLVLLLNRLLAGNMGVVPPVNGFLQGLRDITNEYGALLIFDEVMTGFRVGYNCAQGYFGVTPDLTWKSDRWRFTRWSFWW